MDHESSERIQKLEADVAQLERMVEQINEVIVEQGKSIERLKLQMRGQAESLEEIERERIKSTNAKPPHYQ